MEKAIELQDKHEKILQERAGLMFTGTTENIYGDYNVLGNTGTLSNVTLN